MKAILYQTIDCKITLKYNSGMIGLPFVPVGQSLALSGTPLFKSPQYVELTHTLVAAARHQPLVRRQLPNIVKNYTTLSKAQLEAWRADPSMEHTKLQCVMEKVMSPQYLALRTSCSNGFTDANSMHEKFTTLHQITPDGTIRRGYDAAGEVTQALGMKINHDYHTPKDMVNDSQQPGRPFKVPTMIARKYLKPSKTPDMALDRPGPPGQGRYNSGCTTSNTITVNGLSPMVIAQARPGGRREVILNGPVGDFTSATTESTILAEKDTVTVEPNTLEEVTELVSTMERALKLRPITTTMDLRLLLKPIRMKAHLDNPKVVF